MKENLLSHLHVDGDGEQQKTLNLAEIWSNM